ELEKQARELAERLSRQQSPAARPVQDAAEQMSRAAGQMEQGDAAERTQDDALDKLDEAQRALDQQREQTAQGELMREQRAKLPDRLRGLQERQKAAVAELTRIHEALKKSPTFPDALAESLSNLRDAEERLRGEVESLAREKFDGLPVFADFLKQAADALDEAARQI